MHLVSDIVEIMDPALIGNRAMLESLLCNSCGAPLEVPVSANFVKCNHCNATLKVHRSSGVTTTEAIEKLRETTEGLAEQVQKLTRQNELESLDRRWEIERQSFMIRDREGGTRTPLRGFAWASGIAAAFFGCIWTIFAISLTSSAPNVGPFAVAKVIFPLFGIGFIVFGLFAAGMTHRKAKQLEEAERQYRRQRERILQGDN